MAGTDTAFYAKLVHNAYALPASRTGHIASDVSHYSAMSFSGTPKSLLNVSTANRRAVYEQVDNQSKEFCSIYIPIDRDNANSLDVEGLPIYVAMRGTQTAYDIYKDINFLLNYETGISLPLSGYQSQKHQIALDIFDVLATTPVNQKIVMVSHSLGCKFALDLWWDLHQSEHINRLHKNVFFNPFLLIDDYYQSSLMDAYIQNSTEAHIIDGDFASVVYKNHPIGDLTIYDNVVHRDGDGWISSLYDLTFAEYLDVRNHQLKSFTGENIVYPDNIYPSFIPDIPAPDEEFGSERQIFSYRTYSLNGYTTTNDLDNQHMYIKHDPTSSTTEKWLLSNIELDSQVHSTETLSLGMVLANKTDMIWIDEQWVFPLIFDGDYSRAFYIIRGPVDGNQLQTYYLAQIRDDNSTALEFYALRQVTGNDYSVRIHQQQQDQETAYELLDLQEFTVRLSSVSNFPGASSQIYQRQLWYIPEFPTVATRDGDLRRSLTSTDINWSSTGFNSLLLLDYYQNATELVIQPTTLTDRYLQLDHTTVDNNQRIYAVVKQSTVSTTQMYSKRWFVNDEHTSGTANKFRMFNHPMVDNTIPATPVGNSLFRLGHQNIAFRLRSFGNDLQGNTVLLNVIEGVFNWVTDLTYTRVAENEYRISLIVSATTVPQDGTDISAYYGDEMVLYWTDFGNSAYPNEIPPFEDAFGTADLVILDNSPHYLNWGGVVRDTFIIRPYDSSIDA